MSRPLVIRFGALYHNDGEPRRNGTLVVEDGRIAAIGNGETATPGNALHFEATCVVPGLVNAHAHLEASGEAHTTNVFLLTTPTQRALTCAANARRSLEAGVKRRQNRAAGADLFADTLIDQHVRVDRHTHGQRDAGDPRQG